MKGAFFLSLLTLLAACRAATGGPYEPSVSAQRDTARAQELNARAADALEGNPAEAERLLREALTADLFFGPAHNNLGVLYLKQGKLYEAAGEIQALARLHVNGPRESQELAGWLAEIEMRGESGRWREWARRERIGADP